MLISREQAADILSPYGVPIDPDMYEKIASYVDALIFWNRKISLTKVTEPAEILSFHFGESFFGSTVADIRHGRLADVGSGAGFPGIPLAMAENELQVTLIDSNAKKTAFISDAARKSRLSNTKVVRSRIEELRFGPDSFEFICSRAFGQFGEFLRWSRPELSSKGKVVLWVGEEDAVKISQDSGWNWQPSVAIPNSNRRSILVGSAKD